MASSSESSAFFFNLHAYNDTGNASFPSHLATTGNATGVNASTSDHVRCVLASRFYIHSVAAGVFCVTGIVTNAFSIAVLSRDRDTSAISSLLLRSLAGVDIFFLLSYVCAWTVFYGFEYFGDASAYHVAYHYLRLYTYPLIFVGQTATIWTTVLIAASRFIAVSLPYYAPTFCTLRSTRHRLIGVLAFSFVYNIPRFFEVRIVDPSPPLHKSPYLTTEFGSSPGYRLIYFDICYYVFNFFLPLVLLTTFNLRLIADYRRLNRKRNAMLSSSGGRSSAARERHEQNLTLIMIIVIVVFVICNSPSRILQVVTSSSTDPKQQQLWCPTRLYFLVETSSVLEILNSTVNFFVYFIFRKQFRHILQRELCSGVASTTTNGRRSTSTNVTTRLNGGGKMETILHDDSRYQTLGK